MTPELKPLDRKEISGRPIVASVSGGQDSTAMALHLIENGLHRQTHWVFADTGHEDPALYEYLDYLEGHIGEITRVGRTGGMAQLVRERMMFPSGKKRFCTEELKTKPIAEFVKQFQDPINAVGIRAQESKARSELPRWQFPKDPLQPDRPSPSSRHFKTIQVWHPIINWTKEDVDAIHKRHNMAKCRLYAQGAPRVGCSPCIYAGKAEGVRIARHSPEMIDKVVAMEEELYRLKCEKVFGKGGHGALRAQDVPTFMQFWEGRKFDPNKDWTFRAWIEWCQTARGGHAGPSEQPRLFDPPGCEKWGHCDPYGFNWEPRPTDMPPHPENMPDLGGGLPDGYCGDPDCRYCEPPWVEV